MSLKSIVLLLVVVAVSSKAAQLGSQFCVDQNDANVVLGKAEISAAAVTATRIIRTGRLPESGLFPSPISCVIVTDLTHGAHPAVAVEINDGGTNQRFIEIKVTSHIGQEINYSFIAYAKD